MTVMVGDGKERNGGVPKIHVRQLHCFCAISVIINMVMWSLIGFKVCIKPFIKTKSTFLLQNKMWYMRLKYETVTQIPNL